MDRRRVKDGIIKRYQNIGRRWKKTYAVLYSDTTFAWYDKQGGSKVGSVLLKDISPHIRVGQECDQLPVRRPNIPDGYSIQHLLAIGSNPSAERFFWFLCSSVEDYNSWHSQIVSTVLNCLSPHTTMPTRSMPATPLPPIGFEHLNNSDRSTVSTSVSYRPNVNRPSHLQLPRSTSYPLLLNTPSHPCNAHMPIRTPPLRESQSRTSINSRHRLFSTTPLRLYSLMNARL
ncbi:hypothetical protein QR680_006939 [Steinernema hermaphroditum]|uniref:PH domain-containing protein n=1 Tax=Steinernema hermaphroditum TaxID=289476 RepID=A0AA39HX41_9BILA|nr:hypothetical protein QR680_006939 [Steinernema hermaphroditum]